MSKNIVWHDTSVTKEERSTLKQQKSCVLWFTGLSGSGKSTLANEVDRRLYELGKHSYILDGDNVRHGLNSDLGFSDKDRKENLRRIGEVAKLFVDSGTIVLAAFISPFREDRGIVRKLVSEEEFIEIYVDCPVEVCEMRDPKGLYRKARQGTITNFTGIDSPYESPVSPELVINTSNSSIGESADRILDYLRDQNLIT